MAHPPCWVIWLMIVSKAEFSREDREGPRRCPIQHTLSPLRVTSRDNSAFARSSPVPHYALRVPHSKRGFAVQGAIHWVRKYFGAAEIALVYGLVAPTISVVTVVG